VTGCVNDLSNIGQVNPLYYWNVLVSNAINIACYMIIGIRVRYVSTRLGSDLLRSQTRIYKSLVVISTVVFGGYLIDTASNMVVSAKASEADGVTQFYLYSWSLAAIGVAASSNGPILYWLASEYRDAFDREWTRLKGKDVPTGARVQHPTGQQSVLFTTTPRKQHVMGQNNSYNVSQATLTAFPIAPIIGGVVTRMASAPKSKNPRRGSVDERNL